MITVLRASGLSIVIYAYDHEPPHVHVVGDGWAKILLFGTDGRPSVVKVVKMKRGDVRKALDAVEAEQEWLLELWREIHG